MDRFVLDRAAQQRLRRGESAGKRRGSEEEREQEAEYAELARS
jgi:hypothetical protein